MLNLLKSSRSAAMISASIIVAAAILGVARAATDTVYRYSSPKTGYLGIDNMDLSPDSADSLDYQNGWDTGLSLDEGNGSACLNAGIHLPNGAIMTELRVFYQGAAGATKPIVTIQRKRYTTGDNNTVAEADLLESATRRALNIPLDASYTTVNNAAYSYGFGVCLRHENDVFYAARISYTYQNAGD